METTDLKDATPPVVAWQCFEDEVYGAVRRHLTEGFFPFDGKAEARRGAEYPGLTPGRTIKIEVSLEAFRAGASEPQIIWLFECKHKINRNVEVGEVRELHSKLQEIGVSRAIGSVVTTIGFQKGAMELAKKLGISLYVLEKGLVPKVKYEAGAGEALHQVIFAQESLDFSEEVRTKEFFRVALTADFGLLVARMLKKPDPADPWERLKKRLKERPIHAGDLHFTRDELHERR